MRKIRNGFGFSVFCCDSEFEVANWINLLLLGDFNSRILVGEFGLSDVELTFGEFGGTDGSFTFFVAIERSRSFWLLHESPHELLFDINRLESSVRFLSFGFCNERARWMLGEWSVLGNGKNLLKLSSVLMCIGGSNRSISGAINLDGECAYFSFCSFRCCASILSILCRISRIRSLENSLIRLGRRLAVDSWICSFSRQPMRKSFGINSGAVVAK